MFGHKKHSSISHSIGASMHVAGDCHFQGALQLDGTVLGDVVADENQSSSIHIGASGRVEGAVRAEHVIVAGTILGPVTATQRLELRATAHIEGDVSYQAMDMRPGATVIGALQPQVIVPAQPKPEVAATAAEPTEELELEPAPEPTEPTLDLEQPLGEEESAE